MSFVESLISGYAHAAGDPKGISYFSYFKSDPLLIWRLFHDFADFLDRIKNACRFEVKLIDTDA